MMSNYSQYVCEMIEYHTGVNCERRDIQLSTIQLIHMAPSFIPMEGHNKRLVLFYQALMPSFFSRLLLL